MSFALPIHLFRIGDHTRRGGAHDWMSRDTRHIDCNATGCKYNVARSCAVPSRCEIKDDGRCAGFEAKALPKKIDGD